MPRQPSAIDVLQQQRSGQPMSEPGLQQPGIDPIMVIASLLGPGILRGLLGQPGASGGALAGGSGMAAPGGAMAPEQGFSQADSLLARLRANQPQIQQGMQQQVAQTELPQFLQGLYPGARMPKFGTPLDTARSPASILKVPDVSDPLAWLHHPQTTPGGMSGYPDWVLGMYKALRDRGPN